MVFGRGTSKGSAKVQTVRWERSEVIKVELVTVRDLKELAADIDEAGQALAALGRQLGFPKMPSHGRQFATGCLAAQ